MRLLYACTDPGIPVDGGKGASIHVRALCRALVAEGHAVTLAAARLDGPPDRLAADLGVAVAPLELDEAARRRLDRAATPARRGALRAHLAAGALAAAAPALAAGGVDAVYERLSLFGAGGRAAARALGVPHVVEVNAPLTDEAARYRGLAWPRRAVAIERAVLSGADAVVAVSAPLAAWAVAQGAAPARVVVLPNGVDAEAMAAGAVERAAVRARLRLADRKVVGFVGHLRPWHGVDDLLAAVARLAADDPAVCLVVVGDGPARPALEARAEALGLGDRVRFLGAVLHAQVPGLVAAFDVAVAPYAADAGAYFSPLKLFEYLAAGRPTVAADLPAVRAAADGGRLARLYPAGDVAALAAALWAALADPASFGMAAAGRAAVRTRHTWRHNARAVAQRIAALTPAAGREAA